tara:strand:+ start:15892 stop:16281 length:390 start_codon:yes stop_codon:yes gene_type:complete
MTIHTVDLASDSYTILDRRGANSNRKAIKKPAAWLSIEVEDETLNAGVPYPRTDIFLLQIEQDISPQQAATDFFAQFIRVRDTYVEAGTREHKRHALFATSSKRIFRIRVVPEKFYSRQLDAFRDLPSK